METLYINSVYKSKECSTQSLRGDRGEVKHFNRADSNILFLKDQLQKSESHTWKHSEFFKHAEMTSIFAVALLY